jgi:hypothetical protein
VGTTRINGVQVDGPSRPLFGTDALTTPSAGIVVPIPAGPLTLQLCFVGCVAASGTTMDLQWMLGASAVGTASTVAVSSATKRTLLLNVVKGALNDWAVGAGVMQPHSATGVATFNVPVITGSTPNAFDGLRIRVAAGAAALSFDAIRVVGAVL